MKFLNKIFNYLIAISLLLYAVFFYLNKKEQLKPVSQTDMSSVDVDKIVNKYLKQTSQKMQQDQHDSNRAIEKAMQQPLNLKKPQEDSPAEGNLEDQIHKEPKDGLIANMNSKVSQEMKSQELSALDKQEYARQFIENARRGGYHIELSDDLEVIKVTPIRNPSGIDSSEILPSN